MVRDEKQLLYTHPTKTAPQEQVGCMNNAVAVRTMLVLYLVHVADKFKLDQMREAVIGVGRSWVVVDDLPLSVVADWLNIVNADALVACHQKIKKQAREYGMWHEPLESAVGTSTSPLDTSELVLYV